MNHLEVILTIGAPGCGKSTWAKEKIKEDPSLVLLCPDTFRAQFGHSESDQSVSDIAFEATKSGLRTALDNGQSAIVDATFMYRKARRDFIHIGRSRGASVKAIVFEMDRETLLERNKKRGDEGGRNVPVHVIDKMLERYQCPENNEFDTIIFVDIKPSKL